MIMDAYGDVDGGDVTKDSEETESTFMCKRCYQKLTRWNVEFQQYQKYKRKNKNSAKKFNPKCKLEDLVENSVVHLVQNCPCGGSTQQVAHDDAEEEMVDQEEAHEEVEEGCTPSKLQKLSLEPTESPSDKQTVRQQRARTPAVKSIKFGFSKGVEDVTGDIAFEQQTIQKVYTATDSFNVERLENKNVASFYLCRICGKFPRSA